MNAHECFAECFKRASCTGSTESSALFGSASAIGIGQARKVGTNRGKEDIAQPCNESFAKNTRVAPTRECTLDSNECSTGVAFAQCFDKFIDGVFRIGNTASGNNSIERRECVACRTGADAQDIGATFR